MVEEITKLNLGRVLVTGGLGFIGTHLVNKLNEYGIEPDICDLKNGTDIRSFDYSEYDTIFHLAALRGVPASYDRMEEYFSTNVYGTYLIMLNKKPSCRMINVTSSSAIKMLSPYGMTKAISEFMGKEFKNVISIRPYNVFGENQLTEAVIPQFIMNSIKGESSTIMGDGLTTRDFSYVGDVVNELIYYAKKDGISTDNKIYNMGYSEERTLNSVLSDVLFLCICSKEPIYLSARRGDQRRSRSTEKFHTDIIGFDKGLRRTVKWFMDNKKSWSEQIDEKKHYKDWDGTILKNKDIERQEEIEKELNCKFIRIKDWVGVEY